MRTSSTSRLAVCAAASIFLFPLACADVADPLGGPTGQVEIATAPLVYPGITGATFAIEVRDSLGALIYENAAVSSDDYGTPDGRILFIAPCSAGNGATPGVGALGEESNTISVELIEVRVNSGALGEPDTVLDGTSPDSYFPPAVEKTITCKENADVRADFLLTFVRRAQQGFADIVVQIQDIFCSYKVSCEDELMADPEEPYAPGPTLVTGFACTDGDAGSTNKFIGFEGTLCCEGETSCTTLSIGAGGAASWSDPGFGVLDTQSYQGAEAILGKVFHNTTWRLNADAVANSCTFSGRGFYNYGGDAVSYAYNPGGDGVSPAPAFFFSTAISPADEEGRMTCDTPLVQVHFGATLPAAQ